MATTKYLEERASVVLVMNTTFIKVKEIMINSNVLYKKWLGMKILTNDALNTEYGKALSIGERNFKLANLAFDQMFAYAATGLTALPATTCVLYYELFSEAELDYYGFLKRKGDLISKDWAPDGLGTDKRAQLDTFVLLFNHMAIHYMNLASFGNYLLESMVMLQFPNELLSSLEGLSCITDTKFEKVTIRECTPASDSMIIEIEIASPSETVSVTKLLQVSYNGYILKAPEPESHWVKKKGELKLHSYKCEALDELNTEAPLCEITMLDTTCSNALIRNDLELILYSCTFTYDTQPTEHCRTLDDGIYVGNYELSIADGTKLVYSTPPVLIYSNNLVTLTEKNGKEIKYPAVIVFTEAKVVVTSLSLLQISMIKTRGMWADYRETFDYMTWITYTSWSVQVMFMPLTLIGMILTCRHKKQLRKTVKLMTAKRKKKENSRENTRLLESVNL